MDRSLLIVMSSCNVIDIRMIKITLPKVIELYISKKILRKNRIELIFINTTILIIIFLCSIVYILMLFFVLFKTRS